MSRGSNQQGVSRQGMRPIARLSPEEQARFDKLRAELGAKRLAKLLRVGEGSVVKLEHGGYASPETVARVVAGMGER